MPEEVRNTKTVKCSFNLTMQMIEQMGSINRQIIKGYLEDNLALMLRCRSGTIKDIYWTSENVDDVHGVAGVRYTATVTYYPGNYFPLSSTIGNTNVIVRDEYNGGDPNGLIF